MNSYPKVPVHKAISAIKPLYINNKNDKEHGTVQKVSLLQFAKIYIHTHNDNTIKRRVWHKKYVQRNYVSTIFNVF